MKIFLDECIPKPLKRELPEHFVTHISQIPQWLGIGNGELIELAEKQFEIFITMDKSQGFQHNLQSSRLAFILLRARSNRMEDLLPLIPKLHGIISTIKPGELKILK